MSNGQVFALILSIVDGGRGNFLKVSYILNKTVNHLTAVVMTIQSRNKMSGIPVKNHGKKHKVFLRKPK